MYFNELDELHDILDSIIFEDEPNIFTEEYALELIESALYLMEEYINDNPSAISEPDFNMYLIKII